MAQDAPEADTINVAFRKADARDVITPVSTIKCPCSVKSPGPMLQMIGWPARNSLCTPSTVHLVICQECTPSRDAPSVIKAQSVTSFVQYPHSILKSATFFGVALPSPVSPVTTMARQVGPHPLTAIVPLPYDAYPHVWSH